MFLSIGPELFFLAQSKASNFKLKSLTNMTLSERLLIVSSRLKFLDNTIGSGHRRLARSFNLCCRYIDDLIVVNNKKFLDYL